MRGLGTDKGERGHKYQTFCGRHSRMVPEGIASREPCRAMERGENITAMRTRLEREKERRREPVIARMVNAGSLLRLPAINSSKLKL